MRSIRVHLLILVLGAVLPPALLTGILVWRAFESDRATSERRLLDSARVDAAALDREFGNTISLLDALGTSPALTRGDLAEFHDEGRRVQSTRPGWYTIMLLSPEGRQLVSTLLPWGTPLQDAAEPESVQRVVQSRQPAVGGVRQTLGGDLEHIFAVRIPVIRDGTLKYVLSAIINVESLASTIPKQAPNSQEWTRTILDSNGRIAVRTRGGDNFIGTRASDAFRERLQRGPETISRERTREGLPVYAATSRGAYGWTAIVVVPRAVLDEPLRASIAGVLTGGVLLVVFGLAAALTLSRRLSRDLEAATAAAEAVAAGRPLPPGNARLAETLRLQRSLATSASLLEHRVRERDAEVQRADAARAEAQKANRAKDEFLAVLGHELRNPLAPALTALELMKARDPKTFSREREVLERQIAHMTRLVNDLLDISRLSRGKVQLDRRRFELSEAVDRALDMARPLIVQRQHRLDVSVRTEGLMLDADIDRLVQVLSNLLTNAARYTPPGGHVALAADGVGDQIVITCEDSGPGIPDELVAALFEPFVQGPRALDRTEGGLGLGLALARVFTELHGGAIRFDGPGTLNGSRFVITLPRAERDAAAASPAQVRDDSPTVPHRVLVVDDNADAGEMLRSALEGAGHEIAVASNGTDAVEIADTFQPGVAVLDIGLPGMDGYELARRLRRKHPRIRLVALTGYGRTADIENATAAGFDAHCAKPVTTATLLRCIQSPAPT